MQFMFAPNIKCNTLCIHKRNCMQMMFSTCTHAKKIHGFYRHFEIDLIFYCHFYENMTNHSIVLIFNVSAARSLASSNFIEFSKYCHVLKAKLKFTRCFRHAFMIVWFFLLLPIVSLASHKCKYGNHAISIRNKAYLVWNLKNGFSSLFTLPS